MSVLFVVAHCNLFNFHLDVASQITGSLAALRGNPRTPLVLRNVKRAVVFFFLFFLTRLSRDLAFTGIAIHLLCPGVKGRAAGPPWKSCDSERKHIK